MAMIVPAKYVMKTQELVELEDLNKTYISVPLIVLLLKANFEEITKVFTIWPNK